VTIEVRDYIGPPAQQCPEHRGYYYFVCLRCYELEHGAERHQAPGQAAPAKKRGRRKGGV
jgi:hypothetical protein